MRLLLFIAILLGSYHSLSQSTQKYDSKYANFYRAEELFEKEQYSAARKEFRDFVSNFDGNYSDPLRIKALYYEGISALELFNNDAVDLLELFNREFPESIYKYDICFRIGRYFYQKKDYKKAIQWYEQLEPRNIELANLDEYYFKLGYSNFHEENYPAAKLAFYEIKDSMNQYGTPALYYYSHICYIDSSYQTALEGFEKLMADKRFSSVVPYYITQIYYMQERYKDVTTFAPAHLDSLKPNEQIEMNHVIGDSYFRLAQYDEAITYLERYEAKANTSRDDDFELGVAYARTGDCTKAVKYLDKVARSKDTLGQISLYKAAECYMNLKEFAYARTAFEQASVINYDKDIQEDALYNFAVLSYKLDINAFDEAVEAFELYLAKYPNSPRKPTIYQYLVNVYSSTKNYEKALKSLDQLDNKDTKLKTAYQLIAFNRGVELFQISEYDKSLAAFKLVEKYPMSNEISAKATYWIAETNYKQKNYKAAISNFDKALGMPGTLSAGLRPDCYYNKGYAYYTEKNYSDAKNAFDAFTKEKAKDKKNLADGYLRLGDCYYLLRDDASAIKNYEKVVSMAQGSEDRALYYMSRAYNYTGGKIDKKMECLHNIVNNYKNSEYTQRAIQDIAWSYYNAGEYAKAERYYQQIITDYPNSSFVKEAYHFMGDIALKQGNYVLAEQRYKKVLTDYSLVDSVCRREVYSLAQVYRAADQLEKIEDLPKLYACADSVANEVEDDFFAKGFNAYEDKTYQIALSELEKYLTKFPNGKFKTDASAYKADCLFNLKREEEAIAVYRTMLEGKDNDYTELAASRSAKFLFNNEKHQDALPYYERVEKVGSTPENLNNARIGQMRCHFLLENYTNSAVYAKKVLNSSQTSQVKLESEYIFGLSQSKLSFYSEAKTALEYVVKNTTTSWASECKFTLAENYFKQNDLNKAETTVRELLKLKPGYNYWLAKGLMLQTRVLMAKKDYFQAESTINSVLDNYTDTEDGILTEANELYDEIMQLKTQPKSAEKTMQQPTIINVEETPTKP